MAGPKQKHSPRTLRGGRRALGRPQEPILPRVGSPEDLKALTSTELVQVAKEARQRIIDVMSVSGGHLASNLGSVELTVALHRVFSCPTDKIIWDTSHQTYTHKLLTGRLDRFHTVRQYKGLAGFSNPQESPYDHFFAGHGGTALSLALGMAKNRDLSGRSETVIAVVGDAVFGCGLTLEALNNIPSNLERFIVVLNDNGMSISPNVGRVTHILSRLINNPKSTRLCQELKRYIARVPTYGQGLVRRGKRFAESVKNLVSPAAFFEQYGLHYIGPIDGHDVRKMVSLFSELQRRKIGPVLVHVRTNKGEGMPEALKNPTSYHGCSPFDPQTGKLLPKPPSKPTFPMVFGQHILQMAQSDPSLVCVTPAMATGSCLDAFMKQFPDRCLDVGIAEGHAVTFCGGLAYGKKMKVVACIYSTFLQRAFDNVFHDVCLQELPVVFAIDRGGIAAGDGHTHNGVYDIAFLSSMPNMVICQPRNGQLLKELVESAFSYGRPVAIRYPKLPTEVEPDRPLGVRELGQAEVLIEGEEILILGLGHMCQVALDVRELLRENYGISATVVDPIFVKPLDADLLCRLLVSHERLITIEEHGVGGLGSIVNDFLMRHAYQNVSIVNCGVPAAFIAQGKHSELMKEIGLTPSQIVRRAAAHFGLKAPTTVR